MKLSILCLTILLIQLCLGPQCAHGDRDRGRSGVDWRDSEDGQGRGRKQGNQGGSEWRGRGDVWTQGRLDDGSDESDEDTSDESYEEDDHDNYARWSKGGRSKRNDVSDEDSDESDEDGVYFDGNARREKVRGSRRDDRSRDESDEHRRSHSNAGGSRGRNEDKYRPQQRSYDRNEETIRDGEKREVRGGARYDEQWGAGKGGENSGKWQGEGRQLVPPKNRQGQDTRSYPGPRTQDRRDSGPKRDFGPGMSPEGSIACPRFDSHHTRVTCLDEGGNVTPCTGSTLVGEGVALECKLGHIPRAPVKSDVITCEEGGNWSGPAFSCIPQDLTVIGYVKSLGSGYLKLYQEPKDAQRAERRCTKDGGRLLVLDTPEKREFAEDVLEYLSPPRSSQGRPNAGPGMGVSSVNGIYVGVRDGASGSAVKDGCAVKASQDPQCFALTLDSRCPIDIPCDTRLPFICEATRGEE